MKAPITEFSQITLSTPLTLYHCGHEQCAPSHSFGPAIRPHYLFHYVLGGRGQYCVNGQTYHLTKGNGFLINPGVSTVYTADEHDPWEYCWIGFDGYGVKTILQDCGLTSTNPIFTDTGHGELKDYFMNLIKDFTKGRGNEYTYLGLLYLCFAHMYAAAPTGSTGFYYEDYIEKALDYIHHNYTYDIKVEDVSKYIGIDRTYLYKLFMREKKISPQQYLINYRLNMAEKLLRETDLSVTEIAYSCGFKDAPAFYKHFKKHLAITPTKYRSDKDHFIL